MGSFKSVSLPEHGMAFCGRLRSSRTPSVVIWDANDARLQSQVVGYLRQILNNRLDVEVTEVAAAAFKPDGWGLHRTVQLTRGGSTLIIAELSHPEFSPDQNAWWDQHLVSVLREKFPSSVGEIEECVAE